MTQTMETGLRECDYYCQAGGTHVGGHLLKLGGGFVSGQQANTWVLGAGVSVNDAGVQ